MKIDILLLTHKRPMLFKRCINSVFKQREIEGSDVCVYINNDTKDIEETYSDEIKTTYSYVSCNELSDIYKHLYDQSSGDYVMFLEDDDYLKSDYLKNIIRETADIYFTNYISMPIINSDGITSISKTYQSKKLIGKNSLDEFRKHFQPRYFQMSQVLFKRNLASNFFSQPARPSVLDYDLKLFTSFPGDASVLYLYKPLWVQTTDGNDNLSFSHLTKSKMPVT